MCGIAAIFAYGESAPPVDRDELLRIRDQMESRGPDGIGEWISADRRIVLGHRRLSFAIVPQQRRRLLQVQSGMSIEKPLPVAWK